MFPWFVDRAAFQMYRWVISVQSGSHPQGLSLQTTKRSMFWNLSKATSTSKQFTKPQLIFHSKNIKFKIKNKLLSFRARPHIMRVVMMISLNTSIR